MNENSIKLIKAIYAESCDFCVFQEKLGRHYCLLHSETIKNMDTVRCADWTDEDESEDKDAAAGVDRNDTPF